MMKEKVFRVIYIKVKVKVKVKRELTDRERQSNRVIEKRKRKGIAKLY